jgi:hypothetical protein
MAIRIWLRSAAANGDGTAGQDFLRTGGRGEEATHTLVDVQALGPHLGSLQGELKLNILKEALSEIHPVDLADIVEELDSEQRVTLLEGLEPSHASDTLEEINPAV